MKYFFYFILAIIAGALFLPRSGTEIRNVPLLITILLFALAIYLFRVLKYICLMIRANKILKQNGFHCVKLVAIPFNLSHGRYQMMFQNETDILNLVLLVQKKKYQHYYFQDANHMEFYSTNRLVLKGNRFRGAVISDLTETKLCGQQTIKWCQSPKDLNETKLLLFDRLPFKITDSAKREELGNGDEICASKAYVFDLKGLNEKSFDTAI